ncbi:AI-2E family transporter [Patescibacteria group bacterium]|nr:AI-2E family transporter [Patescibacteria group bacterium]MBU1673153.1 AI-2E family transporter [Patescibacteria group bacterium]MBU1963474.1 AI-2E family transporter [Patescibacteria group bacterium]
MAENKTYQVNISTYTIIKIVFVLLLLIFLYNIITVVGIVFVAWVFASAMDPLIDRMQRWKIPRGISILLIYLLGAGILTAVGFLMVPPLVEQIKELSENFPAYYDQVMAIIPSAEGLDLQTTIQNSLGSITESLGSLSGSVVSAAAGVLNLLIGAIAVLVIAFYMTIHENSIRKFLQIIAPIRYQPYLIQKMHTIQRKLGSWLWGQIILMLIIGTLAFIGLKILGVQYALLLAIIAGIGEFIPIVGPILSAVPAVFFAFADSPVKALLVIILYIVIQQLENHIIVPKVMHKAVGLNPLIIIFAMLVGAQVAGLVGVIVAIPASTIIGIFLKDFVAEKERKDLSLEEEGGEGKNNKKVAAKKA